MSVISTIKEADALFDSYAVRKIALEAKKAAHKKKIAALQESFKAEIKSEEDALKSMEAVIEQFDTAEENAAYFAEPRKRKRPNGAHGLQTSTILVYDNPVTKDQLAESESDRLGIELCTRTVVANDDLIRAALTAGEKIRGVHLQTVVKLVLTTKKHAAED